MIKLYFVCFSFMKVGYNFELEFVCEFVIYINKCIFLIGKVGIGKIIFLKIFKVKLFKWLVVVVFIGVVVINVGG